MDNFNDEQHLLLSIKSLTHSRNDKKYLIGINSLDSGCYCEIEDVFEHNYQYLYKLWPCRNSTREFVKIEMFERVQNEELIKRGEASPLVIYSQEGQKCQFTGSREGKCVLILKFKVKRLSKLEKQISTQELENLNEQIEQQLIKNKQQRQVYNSYLEQTTKFLNRLSNRRYLNVQNIQADSESNDAQQVYDDTQQVYDIPNYGFKQKERVIKGQELTNLKYIQLSTELPSFKKHFMIKKQEQMQNSMSIVINQKPNQSLVNNEIRRRRDLYTKNHEKGEQVKQRIAQSLWSKTANRSIQNNQKAVVSDKSSKRQSQQSINIQKDESFKERRKKCFTQNKQVKQSYQYSLKRIQDVNLGSIFIKPLAKQIENRQPMRIQFVLMQAHLYKGIFQKPKRLLILHDKIKYQTMQSNMRSNSVQWQNKIIIPKTSQSENIHCEVISIQQFGSSSEGTATFQISDFKQNCRSLKAYLYSNGLVIGSLQLTFVASPYVEGSETQKQEELTKRVNRQRKIVSLPQISIKTNHQQQRQKTNKRSVKRIKNDLSKFEITTTKQRYATQIGNKEQISNKIKSKKLKVRAHFK